VELAFGFGPSFGEMQVGETMNTAVNMGGLGFEASLSYSRPISEALSVVVGMGLRAIIASASKVEDTNTRGSYASFPARLGVRW
jgi:hypothetical protein